MVGHRYLLMLTAAKQETLGLAVGTDGFGLDI